MLSRSIACILFVLSVAIALPLVIKLGTLGPSVLLGTLLGPVLATGLDMGWSGARSS